MLSGRALQPPFWWGSATSAYQIEGAVSEGGRGWSVWDQFAATPGKTYNGDNGMPADDFYHRFQEDIDLMGELGIQNFRLSIAWPRIFPNGTGVVNREGLDFYNRVIDALLEAGIEPHVTLYHWDLPQALQDRYGGWNGGQIVDDFSKYAAAVFLELGDRVKHWTTFNEPWTFCFLGYGIGVHAPGISGEAWQCVYHVLLAHGKATAAFRGIVPDGKIAMNLNCDWFEPFSSSEADKEAAQRAIEFRMGIFADPIYFGDWPASVKKLVANLPQFTPEQAESLNGTFDYFPLNFYTSQYAAYEEGGQGGEGQGRTDYRTTQEHGPNGAIGERTASPWLYVTPWGIRKMLNWLYNRYHPAEVVITENGVDVPQEDTAAYPDVLDDHFRVDFYKSYLEEVVKAATDDKIPIVGYFAWSLLDNFEWADGYSKRFGIVYVDYKTQARSPKRSAKVLSALFGTDDNSSKRSR